jgi:tetratricopeptide (TPR) repeat protein
VALRILLLFVIALFSFLGYVTYLNHGIPTTFFLVKGKPFTTSLPAVIIISFASGALIVFVAGVIRDLLEGWRAVIRDRNSKKREAVQLEIAKGLDFLSKGDLKKSRIHLTNALERDPDNLDILARLSDILASQGELREALEILERGLAIGSHNREILLRKARIYDQMGNSTLAVDTFGMVLVNEPNNLAALLELRRLCLRQENWKEALSFQERILRTITREADAPREKNFYLGLKYEHAQSLTTHGNEESLKKALRLCKEIIKQEKDFQPAYVLLGDIYKKQERWAEAGKILGKGFHVSKSVVFLLRLEDLYLKRDDSKTLVKIYRRMLQSNPDNLVIPFLYSRLCLRLNMLDEAMDELVEIKKRGKDLPALHGLMAEVLAQKGQIEEAVQEYKRNAEFTGFLRFPFLCRSCQRQSVEWVARCPSCQQWNTYYQQGEEKLSKQVHP